MKVIDLEFIFIFAALGVAICAFVWAAEALLMDSYRKKNWRITLDKAQKRQHKADWGDQYDEARQQAEEREEA